MHNYFLLISTVSILIFSSCPSSTPEQNNTSEKQSTETESITEKEDIIVQDSLLTFKKTNHPEEEYETLKAHVLSAQDFINTPITLSIDSHMSLEKEDYDDEDDQHVSHHHQNLKFKNSRIRITDDKFELLSIKDSEIFLVKEIKVGMSKAEFLHKFEGIADHDNNPYISLGEDLIRMGNTEGENDVWNFFFENDSLSEIMFMASGV